MPQSNSAIEAPTSGSELREAPLVSIVTPSLNQGRFIRGAIDSVLDQDYPNIEYIIMDGGSSDETAMVAREYSDRLTFVCEPDRGQSHAINKAWRLARGEILSWLCADDLLLPGAVSAVVAEFTRQPEVGLVYGDCEEIDLDDNVLAVSCSGPPDTWKLIHCADNIPQPSAFARREIVEAVGFVDEGLHWSMDWELFMRIALSARMAYLPQRLSRTRTYDETKTHSGGRARFRELVRVMRRHGDRRYPPVFFFYGLWTLRRSSERSLSRWPEALSPVSRRAARLVDGVCQLGMERAIQRGQGGWYPDGWAGPTVDRILPPATKTLRVRGRVPSKYSRLSGQEVSVEIDGAGIGRWRVGEGEFEFHVPISRGPSLRAPRVRIRAQRYFVPRREGINRDRRRLSYYLDELDGLPGDLLASSAG